MKIKYEPYLTEPLLKCTDRPHPLQNPVFYIVNVTNCIFSPIF